MTLQAQLMQQLTAAEPEMIKIRRHLHAHPEISFHEEQTAAYIKAFYRELGVSTTAYGDGYGFVVDIDSGHPGPQLALRADFDGLAIQEDNHLSFKSQNANVMHACGHDGHTAYLMVLAKTLLGLKNQLRGRVRIIHQPAEEVSPGGAKGMLAAGVLDGIDNVIGLHVMSTMPTGSIAYHLNATQTGRANFTVTFTGKGGHASMPHLSNDAIVAGSYFVTALQTVVSRRIDPFDTGSVTIGSFDGVGSFNAIKAQVTLKGDVRIMDETTRQTIRDQITKIANGVGATFGVQVALDYDDNYPVLMNDATLTQRVITSIQVAQIPEITKIFDCGPQDPSEDFAYFAQAKPSTFIYAGCQTAPGETHPHHSPDFMMNEDCLLIAAKAVGTAALDYLMNASSDH
ncbi:amidohydrolase [Lactiplantibacillus plantarum]|jgi:amidohydrolase|uniref:amidohydrolase n=1 Tax=Lactiplantibacillus plantarum TaxID=1590 RepID=UPI00046AB3DC|nr:amidohydrolase [Lactiplantibacillus plantarum]AZN84029.1 amidohydrolase [Lactiplantibacillus plantarum subsp. plantarum]KIN21742.1 amidohydrolase [Lactiplantibacillus plantarum]KZU58730.1 Catalyzes the cleavage ofp-aminobenzoyl-glutamate to p-aminobenzoate andglutamate subunit A [Lactiplantibacillus plantarum]MCT1225351.1 amidohydrolase [Lactiplantibacillus plantarum]MCT3227312.1 amidohydrolase [Lactiplantibacillus plantarum]